jgi:hypothetical protein
MAVRSTEAIQRNEDLVTDRPVQTDRSVGNSCAPVAAQQRSHDSLGTCTETDRSVRNVGLIVLPRDTLKDADERHAGKRLRRTEVRVDALCKLLFGSFIEMRRARP